MFTFTKLYDRSISRAQLIYSIARTMLLIGLQASVKVLRDTGLYIVYYTSQVRVRNVHSSFKRLKRITALTKNAFLHFQSLKTFFTFQTVLFAGENVFF